MKRSLGPLSVDSWDDLPHWRKSRRTKIGFYTKRVFALVLIHRSSEAPGAPYYGSRSVQVSWGKRK